ncbi:hypothetical protein E2C01_099491 [Portunus trituberculatus]|uniref:Uncharacterized protein n=1 Tax=Portunus trituberculatus TaxID=210409 RepID=A0A5B7KAI2_PORTR|nr:hypothetical protein [Portunus trituberculatus]
MSSSDSGTVWASMPLGPSLAHRRASGSSQDRRSRDSGTDRGVAVSAGRRVSQHSSRHGARLMGAGSAATDPQPTTTQASAPQWYLVLDALAELRSEINLLKADRGVSPSVSWTPVAPSASSSPQPWAVNEGVGPSRGMTTMGSLGSFSGFVDEASCDEEDVGLPPPAEGPLHHSAKVFGPPEVHSE